MYEVIFQVLWFILPAYVANSTAIDVSKLPLLRKFNAPIDAGKSWRGKPIFGEGKTWRGFICGVIAGVLCGMLQTNYHNYVEKLMGGIELPEVSTHLAFLLSLGAMIGDLSASFIKRRMNFPRGAMLPLVDQLDYIFGAFFLAWTEVHVNLYWLGIAILITLPLHFLAYLIAYSIRLKDVWW